MRHDKRPHENWRKLRRRARYTMHEFRQWWNGTERDEYQRNVDRCRLLELPDIIENWAGIPDGGC